MSWAGMTMMVLSYGVVLSLTLYCFYRVLITPGTPETEHSPLDINTHDEDPKGSGTRYD